ncbi:MAG: metallopeptidase family protein [Pseudomonadota bacterium]
MLPNTATPPDLTEFRAMVGRAYAELPAFVRQKRQGLVLAVAEEADVETLHQLEITDPLHLTGLFDGIPWADRTSDSAPSIPNTIWLFRRPILAEWRDRGDVMLTDLISHVLVHEIAHHFGFTDDDIAAIDQWWL